MMAEAQQSQAAMPAASPNGRAVTYTLVGIVVTAVILAVSGTAYAINRFGVCESRISVLETNYGHIGQTLERIERKLDERRQ